MDEHAIHHLHEFLPHLARRQPELLELLPEEERPDLSAPLSEWVLSLPQRRRMEICTEWVLATMQRLKERSPLSQVLLGGAIRMPGEFDLGDAAAVAIGEVPALGDPRREEIRLALGHAVRMGVLIHLAREERFCVPFPVQLSCQGVPLFRDEQTVARTYRMILHFAGVSRELREGGDQSMPRHWRFTNLLEAWDQAVCELEEAADGDLAVLQSTGAPAGAADPALLGALVEFALLMGRGLAARDSDADARLLAASAIAARIAGDVERHAEFQNMLGNYYMRRRHFPRALDSYRAEEKLRMSGNDRRGAVLAIGAAAIAQKELGSRELAVADFLRAWQRASEWGLPDLALHTANCAAQLLVALGRFHEAATMLEAAAADATASGTASVAARAELAELMGDAWRGLGDREAAEAKYLLAASLATTAGHRPIEASACLKVGQVHFAAGDEAEGFKWMRRAMALFTEVGDYAGLARVHLELAHSRTGPGSEARGELLVKALRYAQAARDYGLVGAIWRDRAEMAAEELREPQAIACRREEARALRKARDVAGLVRAHLAQAELHLRLEDGISAAGAALRAQGLARAWQLDDLDGEVAVQLAACHRHLTIEQFEFVADTVTEELESGELGPES